ncbi:hypothetical protein [Ferrovum sp.]|uniref:hypothetical protein n=1 Tax=Ferrovum sp. TaxID=2609467 RepID=UPI00261AF4FD|nr:hypothetical protein [Ferrovum sp.]
MITREEKTKALASIHPSRDDILYIERVHPGTVEWFSEKLAAPVLCKPGDYLPDLVYDLELGHRLGMEPRTGILMHPIFRRLLSFLCIHHLADRLDLPDLLDALEWPPHAGRASRITMALNGLVSEPLDARSIQAADAFAQAHPSPSPVNVTVTEKADPPDPVGAHGGQEPDDKIDELLNVEW